ncbi:hypothetical protein B296_00022508 [Ensete ventricosum]|uniref:Uncharacterized protein n=1 Tax=Ensete ventricosum TaxID=4639 RepID=A0A427AIU4_ENSVE|nr:hypothetical protein B296_00022508 [Ensete ventricosum]
MPRWLGMDGDLEFLGPVRCQGRGRFEPDCKSNFTTELARQSGRLRELPRLGAVVAPPQARSPGSGLQATPFTEIPSREPIGELPTCLDLVSEVEKSLGRDDERSRVGRGCRGFYSNGYGAPVPEVLIAPVAYHAVVLHRSFRGPRDELPQVSFEVDSVRSKWQCLHQKGGSARKAAPSSKAIFVRGCEVSIQNEMEEESIMHCPAQRLLL